MIKIKYLKHLHFLSKTNDLKKILYNSKSYIPMILLNIDENSLKVLEEKKSIMVIVRGLFSFIKK